MKLSRETTVKARGSCQSRLASRLEVGTALGVGVPLDDGFRRPRPSPARAETGVGAGVGVEVKVEVPLEWLEEKFRGSQQRSAKIRPGKFRGAMFGILFLVLAGASSGVVGLGVRNRGSHSKQLHYADGDDNTSNFSMTDQTEMDLIEAQRTSLESSLNTLNDSLDVAFAELSGVKWQLENADDAVIEVNAAGLKAQAMVDRENSTFAEVNSSMDELDNSTEALSNRLAALESKVKNLDQTLSINATDGSPDVESQLEGARLKLLANKTGIRYDLLGRLSELERRLRVNVTLLADDALRRQVTKRIEERLSELAKDIA